MDGIKLRSMIWIVSLVAVSLGADSLPARSNTSNSAAEHSQDLGRDTETLEHMEKVAGAYRRRGLYSCAEAIIRDVFERRREKKGSDDPEMAYYHDSLALLQTEQAKYSAAESNYLRAIAITENHWGADHPDLAGYFNNLAGVYLFQARFTEAEGLYRRCLELWERFSDHPNVASPRRSKILPSSTAQAGDQTKPSRFTSARSRSPKKHSGKAIPIQSRCGRAI